jgi:predicted nucleic acid-binding protein
MSARFFIDTNVLVYTFDAEQPDKRERATDLVAAALGGGAGTISYQVVQEFLNVALHKFASPMTTDDAARYLRTVLEPLCSIFPSTVLYERALSLRNRWRYRFYDSLIICAALEAGCETLYSEDLQHGQQIESLTIVDPFARV